VLFGHGRPSFSSEVQSPPSLESGRYRDGLAVTGYRSVEVGI